MLVVNMDIVSLKEVSKESKILLLKELGYQSDGEFVLSNAGQKVIDKYVKNNKIKTALLGLGLSAVIIYSGIKSCNPIGEYFNKNKQNQSSGPPPSTNEDTSKKGEDKSETSVYNCRYDGQFAFDSTTIVKGRKGLEQVIKHWPKNSPIYIAASSSVDGEDGYNLILSQDRAKAIKEEINSIDKEKGINIKGDQGVGETDKFSKTKYFI